MAREKIRYSIRVVELALDLLELFHGPDPELEFSQIRKPLRLEKSRAVKLLATLEHHNLLERNESNGSYRLGVKALQLGQSCSKQMGLLQHARPVQDALVRSCNETCEVAIMRNDFEVVYYHAVEAHHTVRVVPRVGTFPFHCTAAGKVLAAEVNESRMKEHLFGASLTRWTENTICLLPDLEEELKKTSSRGYALETEEYSADVVGVAAPIRDFNGEVVGAIGLSAPTIRLSGERMERELIPRVKEAAKEISQKLGFSETVVREGLIERRPAVRSKRKPVSRAPLPAVPPV